MFNPATVTPPRDTLNVFTEIVKQICLNEGVCWVKIRDGRIFPANYFKETFAGSDDFYEGFNYINREMGIALSWELCGTSVTAKRFDIISLADAV